MPPTGKRHRPLLPLLIFLISQVSWAQHTVLENSPRATITFIFGSDTDPAHPLCSLAETYYRHNTSEKTDRVITDRNSLLEALADLAGNPPANGKPWGVINLVGHGNDMGVMEIPLQAGGDKTTASTLSDAIKDGVLKPVPPGILDERSEIRLIGCCLGKDVLLLELLSKGLGHTRGHRPLVRSSICFTSFESISGKVVRSLAEGWSLALKASENVPDGRIAERFRSKFHRAHLDWTDTLSRTRPRFVGDSYCHLAEGSFQWRAIFSWSKGMPNVETSDQRDRWLRNDPDFRRYVVANGIPWEPDQWKIIASPIRTPDGMERPSILVRGSLRKLYVIKPLLQQTTSGELRPLQPSWEDPRYFMTIR